MSDFFPLEMIASTARPVVYNYLGRAFMNQDAFDDDTMDVRIFANRLALDLETLNELADKIKAMTEDEFDDSALKRRLCDALILDTSMQLINSIPSGDDDHGDYMPDANNQIGLLIDDGYDGNGFLWFALHADHGGDDYRANQYDVYFMDCTSDILLRLNRAINN